MKPTIYIHIGLAKTGTTAIQNFIFINKDILAKYNFYYPRTGMVHNCHHGIAFYWSNNKAFRSCFNVSENQLSNLSLELQEHKNENIIISSECLNMNEVNWHEFLSILPHKNIKIIVYLRRQDNLFSSNYNEAIKGNSTFLPADIWIEKNLNKNNFRNRLDSLLEYININNIIVRVYEKKQFFGGTIYSDFCNAISISAISDFVIPKIDYNPSLSPTILEYNRLLNTVFTDNENPYIFYKYLSDYSQKKNRFEVEKESFNVFSLSKRKEIISACVLDNCYVAKKYLNRDDGRLFFDEIDNVKECIDYNHILSDELIKDISLFIYNNNPSLTKQLLERLVNASASSNYIVEAKNKLIPILLDIVK